jgi:hypothetical protein
MNKKIQTILELIKELNNKDQLIVYEHIKGIIKEEKKENKIQENIDYDKIRNLSWF